MSQRQDRNIYKGFYRETPAGIRVFYPPKAPKILTLPALTEKLLEQACLKIGEVNSLQSLLPNPSLITNPYILKEALLSSQIEGTQSSLSAVLEEQKEISDNIDIREIQNYKRALNLAMNNLSNKSSLPLCNKLLKEIHKELLLNVRGGTPDKTPGEFRTGQNWIGGPSPSTSLFNPCPPEEVAEYMSDLEKYFHSSDLPHLIKAAIIHHQFETIHPFNDGNGRIGRILITLYLMDNKVLAQPTLYISLYFKHYQQEYYDLLMHVRTTGDYIPWIDFFLHAIISVASQVMETTLKILKLKETLTSTIKNITKTKNGHLLLEALFAHPSMSANKILETLDLPKPTAYKIIKEYETSNIIVETTGQTRNRAFVFREFIDIISNTNLTII